MKSVQQIFVVSPLPTIEGPYKRNSEPVGSLFRGGSTAPWRTPEETVSVLSNTNENVDGKHVIGGSIVQ